MIVLKNYENREKGLLRHALTGVLPDDFLWRRKSPYPKTHNPSYLNKVRQWMLTILEDGNSPLRELVDVGKLCSLARLEDDSKKNPWFGQLMSQPQLFAYLIQVDTWLRKYKVELV